MFKHVVFDTWNGLIPLVAFAVTSLVFGYIFVRALKMKKPQADRLARLPLDGASEQSTSTSTTHIQNSHE
jgi:hypothetical protein